MSKVALVTGCLGQDGSYLLDLLLSKPEYQAVYGLKRKTTGTSGSHKMHNISHLLGKDDRLQLRYGDLTDGNSLSSILAEIRFKYNDLTILEIYNMAALSHVGLSFEMPVYAGDVDGLGVMRFLEAIRLSGFSNKIRFLQASTSELYGKVQEVPQTEQTPFYPRSPYGVAKLYGFWAVKNYRESYNLFVCNSIAFNHEGPRRDDIFVTRKITKGLADILEGKASCIKLGNINTSRDMGHAQDYVKGMWLMLQSKIADDYVLSTGETHTIKEFIEKAFSYKGLEVTWKGEELNEVGYDQHGRALIVISDQYYRPAEVDYLLGDSTKARTILGWRPEITFDELVKCMVDTDCN